MEVPDVSRQLDDLFARFQTKLATHLQKIDMQALRNWYLSFVRDNENVTRVLHDLIASKTTIASTTDKYADGASLGLRSHGLVSYYVNSKLDIENLVGQQMGLKPLVSPLCYFALDLGHRRILVVQPDFETVFSQDKAIANVREERDASKVT